MVKKVKYIKNDLSQALINGKLPEDVKASILLHRKDYPEKEQAWVKEQEKEGTFDIGLGEEYNGERADGKECVLDIVGDEYIRLHDKHYKNAKSEVAKLKEKLQEESNAIIEEYNSKKLTILEREASVKAVEKKVLELKEDLEGKIRDQDNIIKKNKDIAKYEAGQEASNNYKDRFEILNDKEENLNKKEKKLQEKDKDIDAHLLENDEYVKDIRQKIGMREREVNKKVEDTTTSFSNYLHKNADIDDDKDTEVKTLLQKLRSPIILDSLDIFDDGQGELLIYKDGAIELLNNLTKEVLPKLVEYENRKSAALKKYEDYAEEIKKEEGVVEPIVPEEIESETVEITDEDELKKIMEQAEKDKGEEAEDLPSKDFTENQYEQEPEEEEFDENMDLNEIGKVDDIMNDDKLKRKKRKVKEE